MKTQTKWMIESPTIDPSIPSDVLQLMVCGSATIFEATRDSLEIAREKNKVVTFEANGIRVMVKPNDDYVLVARDWWFKLYGETPEQSLTKR